MVDLRRLPFGGSDPRTRTEFQQALLRLCAPFADAADFAAQLDATSHPAAHYAPRVARLELVSRLLWGLAPLAAGGGRYAGWPQIRAEIARGTDPEDPGFWGPATDRDQRIVESAALGLALALAPQEVWEPLTAPQRANFAHWMRTAAAAEAVDNNWKLFATLVNLGLAAVGEPCDKEVTAASFARINEFHRGGGWYSDGDVGTPFDYYGPWGIHFYCLINAARGALDSATEAWVRERADLFAGEFAHWFAADGAAIPFGRSLTYRFAQCSFFGALAFAAPASAAGPAASLSWGQLRGLWARNLRWWGCLPVLNGDGTLSIGYGYPCLPMSESYNAPGSPYWAFKAFLPLALPAEHPFWTAQEEPQPRLERVHPQPVASFLLQRNENGHVTALSAGPGGRWARHGEAKYAKFAYSTAFGFSVPSRGLTLEGAAGDSMLLLSDDAGTRWRGREENDEVWPMRDGGGNELVASWSPWPDVHVETMLLPVGDDGRWHARVHSIRTARRLWTAEGGFCVPLDDAATADELAANTPADDAPTDDEPTDDEPATDARAADALADDEPATDKLAADPLAEDALAADTHATDKPATDARAADELAADTHATDEPATDAHAADTHAADALVTDELAAAAAAAAASNSGDAAPRSAFTASRNLRTGIRDLTNNRTGELVRPDPNTHLLWPRTVLPTLRGTLEPGTHNLVTLVYADTAGDAVSFTDGAPTPADLEALGVPHDFFSAPEQGGRPPLSLRSPLR